MRTLTRALLLLPFLALATWEARAQPSPTWKGVGTDGRLAPGAERDNWANTYFAARAAELTYRAKGETESAWQDRVRASLADAGFSSVAFPPRRPGAPGWIDPQCLVASNAGLLVVSFRGTDSPREWVDNIAQARPTRLRGVPDAERLTAHDGFQDATDAVYSGILEEIRRQEEVRRQLGRELRPIWVSGHSLGGALATLTGLRLGYDLQGLAPRPPAVTVYSYSAPRIGNRDFRQRVGERLPVLFRLTYAWDPVPRLPLLGSSEHVDRGYHFPAGGGGAAKAKPLPEPETSILARPEASEKTLAEARTGLLKLERGETPTAAELEAMEKAGFWNDHHLRHLQWAAYRQMPTQQRALFPPP